MLDDAHHIQEKWKANTMSPKRPNTDELSVDEANTPKRARMENEVYFIDNYVSFLRIFLFC